MTISRFHGNKAAGFALPILALSSIFGLTDSANAHVKWFWTFDVARQPVCLANVLCLDFEDLTGLTIFVLVAAGLIENTSLGTALVQSIIGVMAPARWSSVSPSP